MKRGKSKTSSPSSVAYAILCLGLAGFFVWVWKSSNHGTESASSAARANTSAILPPLPPPPLPVPITPPENHATTSILEAQIALVRQGICPGSIDGRPGSQTRAALAAFQKKAHLPGTGLLDAATKSALLVTPPLTVDYTITSDDLQRLLPLSKTWLGKSLQPRLDFETILELLGEKAFSNPQLIRDLNPGVDWNNLLPGTRVTLPNVEYPSISDKAAFVKISLHDCTLEAFDGATNLLVHFPCSIGHVAAKRPEGELHVATIATAPNYTFDPAIFPESPEAQELGHKLILPPGPNNPVGVAWIGLDRPGYGMHGTPSPEKVGRTESHGCFRLANWNAAYLARLVWIGMPVIVE